MENRVKLAIRNIQLSGIRRFNEMAKTKKNMILFTIGEPYFNTPENVKLAGIKAIENNQTFYTQNQGMIELRVAISDFIKEKYHLNYTPKEVIATVGSMEGLSTTLSTLIEADDEVIIPTPCYPGYAPLITLNGGRVVEMNTKKDGFQLTKETILSHITENTKAILITTPNNPSGCVYSKESIEVMVECVKDRDIFVISDEVYREIVYDTDSFISIGEYENIREKVIVILGFSKSHSMTGWRVGYVLADDSIAKHILKTHQYLVTSTCTISQLAAIEALKTSNRDMIEH
ncbi:MAG: aminotransferase class I/II-fold pyridoxal phosphate-dependent enzyme, partial [Fusobacteria bacterium]|nr:aminotransferase class I/II-fold pyridoxal phosphate-dependent enzyme [Fusobacteriota bacterium]